MRTWHLKRSLRPSQLCCLLRCRPMLGNGCPKPSYGSTCRLLGSGAGRCVWLGAGGGRGVAMSRCEWDVGEWGAFIPLHLTGAAAFRAQLGASTLPWLGR
jgi:hypothetical protein